MKLLSKEAGNYMILIVVSVVVANIISAPIKKFVLDWTHPMAKMSGSPVVVNVAAPVETAAA
tara:strand:+ start:14497 stop:14682 length:186 start_codon:yes stop_codon:yes gene_type:complete